jgi:YVTN family beta-propeller protein
MSLGGGRNDEKVENRQTVAITSCWCYTSHGRQFLGVPEGRRRSMGTRYRRSLRLALAGSLMFGCAVTASVLNGAPLASASSVVQTIAVGKGPAGISSDGTHVWVANLGSNTFLGGNTVTELNASDGSVVRTITVGKRPVDTSSDGTHVWVANGSDNTVTELNASDGSVVRTIAVGRGPEGVSSDGTHVWVVNNTDQTVTELNASDGSVIRTIAVGAFPGSVSSDGIHVWVTNLNGNSVTELNASDGSVVRTISMGAFSVSSDGTHVWVTNSGVSELNASDGSLVHTGVKGNGSGGVSSDGTHVWATNSLAKTVTELNASDASFVQTIAVDKDPVRVSADGTHVWVSNLESNSVSEIVPQDFLITTSSLLAATRGSPYAATLSASGGVSPLKWKKLSVLPVGLKLSSTGVLSGTPKLTDAAGPYSVSVQVRDSTKKFHQIAAHTFLLTLS